MEKLQLDIELLLPHIPDERDGCVARLQRALLALRGVSEAHLDRENGKAQLCIHYDPALITLAALRRLAEKAGAQVSNRYHHEIVPIEGMDCSDCVLVVEHGLGRLEGILTASVSYAAGTLRVEYDSMKVSRKAIDARVRGLGYHIPKRGPGAFIEKRRELLFALLSGLCVLASWLGELAGTSAWVTTPLYLAAYFFGGWNVLRHALHALRERHFDTDSLMVLAALGAAILGEFAEGGLLLFLFSFGHALEELALDRARDAVRKLGELAPKTAFVRRDGLEIELPVEQLALDDVVIVRPGSRLPVDGLIVVGASAVNQAPVTGESVPVDKAPGDKVFAGTVSGEGALEVQVTRLAKDSTLARVMRLVEEAQGQKSRTQRLAEKFTRWFVPVVLVTDLLVMFLPLAWGVPFRESFLRAMTLLVAASPCALALGTPSAMLAGVAQAARNGLLVKGGVHLETLGQLQIVAFDKTGTLTHGRPEVTDVLPLDSRLDQGQLLAVAAAVENRSAHPLAQAVVRAGQARGLTWPQAGELTSLTGRGVRSSVNEEEVLIGNLKLFDGSGLDVPESARAEVLALEREGKTTMVVGLASEIVGVLAFADLPRPEAAGALQRLKRLGVRQTLLLTGDNAHIGQQLARDLGLDAVRAELLPEDKVAAIRELAAGQTVAMVGDGVNDAPALAAASVGIAMGGAGTDVALETADVALMGDDLSKLPFAVGLGRATRAVVIQNLGLALGVIASLVVTSVLGLVGIGLAIFLHEGSTLLVVANALRLLRFREQA